MNHVTINGIGYLGTLVNVEGVTSLKGAIRVDVVNKRTLRDAVKAENLGTLYPVEFGGGSTFTKIDLTEAQELDLQIIRLTMKSIKGTALAHVENTALEEALGK